MLHTGNKAVDFTCLLLDELLGHLCEDVMHQRILIPFTVERLESVNLPPVEILHSPEDQLARVQVRPIAQVVAEPDVGVITLSFLKNR